jgi:hypothetical protein
LFLPPIDLHFAGGKLRSVLIKLFSPMDSRVTLSTFPSRDTDSSVLLFLFFGQRKNSVTDLVD